MVLFSFSLDNVGIKSRWHGSSAFSSFRIFCKMSCRISRNRNIEIENLAIICIDFDSISTRFQINSVCYFLTIHFNDYIRQVVFRILHFSFSQIIAFFHYSRNFMTSVYDSPYFWKIFLKVFIWSHF